MSTVSRRVLSDTYWLESLHGKCASTRTKPFASLARVGSVTRLWPLPCTLSSARSYTDAIGRATNHDGDSDSTASIAGQLWGSTRR